MASDITSALAQLLSCIDMPLLALDSLQAKLARGHDLTLVLGAGVSLPRGVPSWADLARLVCARVGVSLPAGFATMHPMALPIVFELAEAGAHRRRASFVEHVRRELYATVVPRRGHDTLSAIGALVRREQASARPRLRRVITFNADDLLERESNQRAHPLAAPVVWPIARESSRPRATRGAGGRPPIPVYHLHGFLPRARSGPPAGKEARSDRDGALVFTDAQYWASFAEPTSFPNRVMANALHDSVCVFVGLSMTDLNLARWLGMRSNAIAADHGGAAPRAALEHHFWIRERPAPGSAEAFVTPFLRKRGVRAIDLAKWAELADVLAHLPAG